MPGAYTILFMLIVLMAVLTYVIPAGRYDLNDTGTVPERTTKSMPTRPGSSGDSLRAPIEGMYGVQDETGNVNAFNYRRSLRRD